MFRVVNWNENFENNRTRELKRLDWVPFPNRHDGDGYTELLDHPDGAAHYGAWCAIVQVASKCDPRGTLSRDGARPHDAHTLARMTRIKDTIIEIAIERLVNIVGWLEVIPDPPYQQGTCDESQSSAGLSHPPAEKRLWNGREGKGIEGKGIDTLSATADDVRKRNSYSAQFQEFWDAFPRRRRTAKGMAWKAWKAAVKKISPAEIISAAVEYAASEKGRGEFAQMPSTWLNSECWQDDRAAWNPTAEKPSRVLSDDELKVWDGSSK